MTNYGINLLQIDKSIKTVSVTKTLFHTLLKAVMDVIHILIRGHNHISGMTEKGNRYAKSDMTYEHNGNRW